MNEGIETAVVLDEGVAERTNPSRAQTTNGGRKRVSTILIFVIYALGSSTTATRANIEKKIKRQRCSPY